MKSTKSPLPIIWSIAGNDSGGGAGLSADQRAADAFGVHLCPLVSSVTAQSTVAVTRIKTVHVDLLTAQIEALMGDMPPRVIKTGLLGGADNARVVAQWVDRLQAQGHRVKLVVDPVMRASTGAEMANERLRIAYQDDLLPRATVITPNRREALLLLDQPEDSDMPVPEIARALQGMGARNVIITGGDDGDRNPSLSMDWMQTEHAQGWLSLPRESVTTTHGTGCTFATSLASAMAMGHVAADAVVLAKMATTHALRQGRSVGQGPGPVCASPGFSLDPTLLPQLSLAESPPSTWTRPPTAPRAPGVYAIVDSADRIEAVLAVKPGVQTIQLRMKRPAGMDGLTWDRHLKNSIERAIRAADAAGVQLVINDHWRTALSCGARALHLGQEDLLGFSADDWTVLQQSREQNGVQLGISSHSLWELCRATAIRPELIACGPVWPTTTKDMPWIPQGLHNLAWWSHMAPVPVVGIGGVLEPSQFAQLAATGARGGCIVRGIGNTPALTLPIWLKAWREGEAARDAGHGASTPELPHPTLSNDDHALARLG